MASPDPHGPGVSRRGFLAGAGALALGATATTTATACTEDRSSSSAPSVTGVVERPDAGAARRVVVIGAGLAGLTAAHAVRDAGWDVVVLEARDRVGGRVHTFRDAAGGGPFDTGLHAEAGGESIDDNHDQIQALLRRFGIATERRPDGRDLNGLVRYQGRTYPTADFVALRGGAVGRDYFRVDTELQRLAEVHRVDPEHPDLADDAVALDRRTLAEFLDSLQLVAEARFLAEQSNVSLYASELKDLSLLFVAAQTAVLAGVPDGSAETMRITGGNDTLPTAMAQALGAAVITASPVEAITRRGDALAVSASGRTFHCAHVVVAVPPSPLRSVRFDPPLPSALQAAIEGLDLGAATKVVNQYRSASWRQDGRSGLTVADLTYRVSWDAADSYVAPAELLTTFTTADNGRALAALSDADRVAAVRVQLDQVRAGSSAELSGPSATMAWSEETLTGGGYAAFKPGQLSAYWGPLRAGTDRIHFAGEHTESLSGYMESAVRSGARAAAAVGAA